MAGSTREVADASGNLAFGLRRLGYGALGLRGATGATVRARPSHRSSSFRYTGRRIDPASREAWPRWGRASPEKGLCHYRARYHAPAIGRFLQTDPVGYDAGLHLYAYVGNDPVNKTDPKGEFAIVGFVVGAGLELTRQIVTGEIKDTSVGGIARNVGKVLLAGVLVPLAAGWRPALPG